MAETTGVINGTLITIYKSTKTIANGISADFTLEKDIINASSKDSAGADESITGRYRFSGSGEFRLEMTGSVGTTQISLQTIITDAMAGTAWTFVFGSGVTGDMKLTGSAYISNVKVSAPDNDTATFTCDFTGSGALSNTTF